jgi:GTP-binding protein LepA
VGYIITGIKVSKEIKVGDTITLLDNPCQQAIKGFEDVKPMVFAGIFPVDNDDFEDLRDSLEKLQLNDASLVFEPETSVALGFGFRCGFLGMLHLEIVQERLSREFNMEVITTVPNVSYNAATTKGEEMVVRTPSDLPDPSRLQYVEEPYIRAQIITKPEYIGIIMTLAMEKRGMLIRQHYLTTDRVELTFELPLAEIVFDFYDRLKSISRGYASFDYYMIDYRQSDLVKMDIKLNGENVDALSALVHRDKAEAFGRQICKRLRDLLQGMLREGLPVRDLERIAEAVHAADPRDPDEAMRRGRATGARGALIPRTACACAEQPGPRRASAAARQKRWRSSGTGRHSAIQGEHKEPRRPERGL